MKKQFVTIFPVAEDVHLVKDVGQIGHFMVIKGGYESTLVCYENGEYPNLQTEATGLNIEFIKPCGQKLFMEQAVLNYLDENSAKIDVLQLFHLTKETIYYGLHFKRLNPSGKLYLKMDVYNETLKNGIVYSKKALKNWYHKRKEKKFLRAVDVVSAENPISQTLLTELFPELKTKCIVLTNGVNGSFINTHFPVIRTQAEKENIILSVGRIGVKEKNYELMVEALLQTDLKDWRLILVGPVEVQFSEWLEKKLELQPEYRNKIELTGAVSDRKTLYEYYNQSKVFCLTSPFESFGIAYAEAMYFGNYIIGNDGHSSFDLLTDNCQLGRRVSKGNPDALAAAFEEAIADPGRLSTLQPQITARAKSHFTWENIIPQLIDRLQ